MTHSEQPNPHRPAHYEDTRWDELYTYCAACHQEWPCDQAPTTGEQQ